MNEDKAKSTKQHYVFNVDIVIEGYNKGMALEILAGLLKLTAIKDFQINSGILVEREEFAAAKPKKKEFSKNTEMNSDPKRTETKLIQEKVPEVKVEALHIINQIEQFKKNNTLIRLSILKGKGVKLSIPCRILNYDDQTRNVTIYHVDEKKVYQYSLNEIEDIIM